MDEVFRCGKPFETLMSDVPFQSKGEQTVGKKHRQVGKKQTVHVHIIWQSGSKTGRDRDMNLSSFAKDEPKSPYQVVSKGPIKRELAGFRAKMVTKKITSNEPWLQGDTLILPY